MIMVIIKMIMMIIKIMNNKSKYSNNTYLLVPQYLYVIRL